jgi:hypothetical protein
MNTANKKIRKYSKFERNWSRFQYFISTNILLIGSLLLLCTFGGYSIYNRFHLVGYSKQFILTLPFFLYVSSAICYIVLILQYAVVFKKNLVSSFVSSFYIFRKPEQYTQFVFLTSLFFTFLFIGLTFELSLAFASISDLDKLNDIFTGSYFIALFISFFIGVYGIIITIVVARQQKLEIFGFERFLEEVSSELRKLKSKVDSYDKLLIPKKGKVIIVDFHPFIGSKSLGSYNAYFKEYISALEHVANNMNIDLTIICHTESLIANSFNIHDNISGTSLIFNKPINDALNVLQAENRVSIWRSDEVGPFHFMVIDNAAFEFIVIPFDNFSSKNILAATKLLEQSKLDYLIKAAWDIVSAAIKPPQLDITEGKELTKSDIVPKYKQEKISGIKLRFQFEENPDLNRNSVINYKRGNYPTKNEIFFCYDDNLKLTNIKESSINLIRLKHRLNESNSGYYKSYVNRACSDKNIPEIDFSKDGNHEIKHKLNSIEYSLLNIVIQNNFIFVEEVLFAFDASNVYLEDRFFSKEIVGERCFLKIKLLNESGHSTEYSYKSQIKIW